MKLPYILYLIIFSGSIFSCQINEDKVLNSNEYDKFLKVTESKIIGDSTLRLNFWNHKIQNDSIQILAMASAAGEYSKLFQATGKIEYLKSAEALLVQSVKKAAIKKETYLLALAQNYISQHRFREAKQAALRAHKLVANSSTQMVLFDATMELGEYAQAEEYLKSLADQSNYNFLIRLAKWNDYKGKLDATIRNMERAKTIAESSNNKGLMLWSYTNLADYYGHAGKIKASYEHYLMALQLDPSNAYAKKGIAWIAYSYEKDPQEALRIIDAILTSYQAPDYFLFKAEIAAYQNDLSTKEINIQKYRDMVKDDRYGEMYNTINALVLAEEEEDFDTALRIMKKEVANRETPETYDHLAYIFFLKGEYQKALEIATEFVQGKTFEPTASLHLAQIYKANGYKEEVKRFKKELLESSYELGPLVVNEIHNL